MGAYFLLIGGFVLIHVAALFITMRRVRSEQVPAKRTRAWMDFALLVLGMCIAAGWVYSM